MDFSAEKSAQVRAAADPRTPVDELIALASLGSNAVNVALARNRSTPVPVVAAIVADVVTEYAQVEPTPPIVGFVFDAAVENRKLSWEMIFAVAEVGYVPALALVLSRPPPATIDFAHLSPVQLMILDHHDNPEIRAAAGTVPRDSEASNDAERTMSDRIRAAKAHNAFRSD